MLSALRNFALTFLVSLLVFGVLAYVIIGFVLNTVIDDPAVPDFSGDKIVTGDDTVSAPDVPPEDTDTPPIEDDIIGETFNILLVESDYQPEIFDDYDYEERWEGPGFPDKRNRTWCADMIILLRVDKAAKQFVLCPIPKNTRVLVNGENMMLGDVISKKNAEFLCGKVSELTGLPTYYYVHAPVGTISPCIDVLGAVTFNVPQDMQAEDTERGLVIDLKKGVQKITGDKATQLLRFTGYPNGNIGRTNTTIEFIKAMFEEYLSEEHLSDALTTYSKIADIVETNFTAEALANNLDLIYSYNDFETVTLTYPGSTKVIGGVTYFEPALSTASALFAKYSHS